MRWYHRLYSRKWTRFVFFPMSNRFVQFGRQFGFSNMYNDHSPTSNGYIHSSVDETSYLMKKPLNGMKHSSLYHEIPMDSNVEDDHHPINDQSICLPLSSYGSNQLVIHPEKTLSLNETFHWLAAFSLIYFLWFICVAGISIIHVMIYFLLLSLFLHSDRTKRFVLAIIIYLAYLFFYDALHLIPNYTISKIHIEDVYLFEKQFFGIDINGHRMTLNEYFRKSHIPFLDVLTGLCYLHWIPIPIAYSLYLYRYKSKREYMDFALTFLLTNIIGFIIYYIIPTAPPWYVELYGFEFNLNAPGNPAGFIHFDQIVGLRIFSSMYSKNANVFAAIPSLHAAYPSLTVLYGSLSKKVWLHGLFVIFTLSVWFSAVYSRHHYVVDVLAGGLCALTAYFVYRYLSRRPWIERYLDGYSKLI